jgi:AcrR family transcriptional regulator
MNANSYVVEVDRMIQKEKLSRRQRDRLRHRDEILAVALRLFSERGYHNVSMQEVADAAEFSVGTLYNLFESKDALVDELMASNTQKIMADILAVLDEPGDERERLRTLFRRQPELMERHAAFMKLHFAEVGCYTAGRVQKGTPKDEFRMVMDTKLSQVIASGIEKHLFRAVDPMVTAKAIHAFMESVAFEVSGHPDEGVIVETFAKAEQLFLNGLLLPGGQENG